MQAELKDHQMLRSRKAADGTQVIAQTLLIRVAYVDCFRLRRAYCGWPLPRLLTAFAASLYAVFARLTSAHAYRNGSQLIVVWQKSCEHMRLFMNYFKTCVQLH